MIDAMLAVDPQAVWVLQSWSFNSIHQFKYINHVTFPQACILRFNAFADIYLPESTRRREKPLLIKDYLGGVAKDRLLLLDLFAEDQPVWEWTDSFFGYPYVWCMLHNFGQKSGMCEQRVR